MHMEVRDHIVSLPWASWVSEISNYSIISPISASYLVCLAFADCIKSDASPDDYTSIRPWWNCIDSMFYC